MAIPYPNKKKNSKNLIDDNTLIDFFCKLLQRGEIKYIRQIERINIRDKKIEELDDTRYQEILIDETLEPKSKNFIKLSAILKEFMNIEKKPEKAQLIRKRKIILQKLWPHFIRNAINLLRYEDLRDRGELKFDFGVKELTDYFKEFSNFEELLYGIDEFYRDHSLHVFRVYLLGEYILREIFPGKYDNIKIFDKPDKIKIKNHEKEAIWCLIALCHDLGYPLQKIDQLNKKLSDILQYFGMTNFQRVKINLPQEGVILDKQILKILSSKLDKELKVSIQSKFYTKYSYSYEKLNHGIMSCILLMKNLVYFKEMDYKPDFRYDKNDELNAKQYLIRREILRSIASHDTHDIYHIEMNNFPFLLIICDEIQEWSRPFSKKRIPYEIESERKEKIQILNFKEDNIEILITLDLNNQDLKLHSIGKFQKFIRLLRSAVDSHKRKFDFSLSIENYRNQKYLFEYENPDKFYLKNKWDPEDPKYYPKPIVERYKNGVKDTYFNLDNVTKLEFDKIYSI